MPRFSLPIFGMRGIGVHICCYTIENNKTYFWLAKRSPHGNFANMWDNSIAGGVAKYHHQSMPSLFEIVQKESYEEASLNAAISQRAELMMELSYCHFSASHIRPDTIFCYHLQLQEHEICAINDNEVAHFEKVDQDTLIDMLQTPEIFKFNCSIVWCLLLCYLQHKKSGSTLAQYLDMSCDVQHTII